MKCVEKRRQEKYYLVSITFWVKKYEISQVIFTGVGNNSNHFLHNTITVYLPPRGYSSRRESNTNNESFRDCSTCFSSSGLKIFQNQEEINKLQTVSITLTNNPPVL